MKNITKLLTNCDYFAHHSPLFKSISIFKFDDLYKHQVALIMHKVLVQRKLENLRNEISILQPNHNYQTRETILRSPTCRLKKTEQNLIYQGIHI